MIARGHGRVRLTCIDDLSHHAREVELMRLLCFLAFLASLVEEWTQYFLLDAPIGLGHGQFFGRVGCLIIFLHTLAANAMIFIG